MRPPVLALLVLALGCGRSAPATQADWAVYSGPRAGVHHTTSVASGCSRDVPTPGSWSVLMSDWTGPKDGLRSVQLVIPASADSTSEFYLGLVFGDLFNGTAYEIERRPNARLPRGRGTIGIERDADGRRIQFSIDAVTADSVRLRGTILCREEEQFNSRTTVRR